MIDETMRKLEERLRAGADTPGRRDELLGLLAQLQSELRELESTHADAARRIAHLTHAAHEATSGGDDPVAARNATDRLTESVREFETTHPTLTSLVRSVSDALAAAGL